jgi:hypothetical protein
MNIFDAYIFTLLSSFNKYNVEYIIVGGYAVNFHGYNRTTGDIDLLLRPTNRNKIKILEALKYIEVKEDTLEGLNSMDFTQYLHFTDGVEPF